MLPVNGQWLERNAEHVQLRPQLWVVGKVSLDVRMFMLVERAAQISD